MITRARITLTDSRRHQPRWRIWIVSMSWLEPFGLPHTSEAAFVTGTTIDAAALAAAGCR
jgi:hypothetical protein